MPYYMAGDYYQGDYYQAGGIFGTIGKALSGVARKLLPAVPFVGPVASNLLPTFSGGGSRSLVLPSGPGAMTPIPEPGLTGLVHRLAPGGHPGYGRYTKDGRFTERRRPRMNATNVRALKRAGRRVRSFLRIARSLGALPIKSSGKGKQMFKRKRKS